jgi:lysophospholipase L1-like esterase
MEVSKLNRRSFLALGGAALAATTALASSLPKNTSDLAPPIVDAPKKKVLLIGDFVKKRYQTRVMDMLSEKAEIISPLDNCGSSMDVLRNMEGWIKKYDPDIVHVNAGFEDLRTIYYGSSENLVNKKTYERNVYNLLEMIYLFSEKAVPVWATITPINEEVLAAEKLKVKDFSIFADDITEYNAKALRACKKLKVTVNDLYTVVNYSGGNSLFDENGIDFNRKGNESIARAVVTQIENFI